MSGWFIFAVIACIVLCTGCVLAVAMLKAAWSHKEREQLTSADLRALEESALCLIDQLKVEADQAIEDLDKKCVVLADLVKTADDKIAELKALELSRSKTQAQPSFDMASQQAVDPRRQQVLDLAASGIDSAEIARRIGMDCAEVKLMLRLAETQLN